MKKGKQELEAARWSSWPASMCKGPEHRGHWAGVTAPVAKGHGGQMSSSIKTLTVFKEGASLRLDLWTPFLKVLKSWPGFGDGLNSWTVGTQDSQLLQLQW